MWQIATTVWAVRLRSRYTYVSNEDAGEHTFGSDGIANDAVHHAHRVALPVQDLLDRATLRDTCSPHRMTVYTAAGCNSGHCSSCPR